MAYDTLKLWSPRLPEHIASLIEHQLMTVQKIHGPTGELMWSLTSGELEGSYDHRVRVLVKRKRAVAVPMLQMGDALGERLKLSSSHRKQQVSHLEFVDCEPYLELEGSVHKALLGHNVYGGPEALLPAARWLVAECGVQLGVELPDGAEWELRQADLAEVYRLGFAGVQLYIRGMQGAEFPWRQGKKQTYGDHGLFFPGQTSALKLYHKGVEFAKHDGRRLRRLLSDGELVSLQEEANEFLRVEVAIKAPTLDRKYGHRPTVREVADEDLIVIADREVTRLIREGDSMQIVRKHYEVRDRLFQTYVKNPRLAGLLFGTWLQLAALGESATRDKMARRTFYLHKKQLQDAGVSWHGSDVRIVETASVLPADFRPVRSDPRRVTGEDPKVVELLAPYRRVA
jgi:II/X family phage/plasmid replication protein